MDKILIAGAGGAPTENVIHSLRHAKKSYKIIEENSKKRK